MKKICKECKSLKSSSDYYGQQGECKECTKERTKKNRLAKLEYYQEYDRNRASLPHRVEQRQEIAERWKKDPKLKKRRNKLSAEWRERNAVKRSAHLLMQYAVRAGRIKKQPCEICGDIKVDAHHDDYTKPLEVMWLCKNHHADRHKELRKIERKKKHEKL